METLRGTLAHPNTPLMTHLQTSSRAMRWFFLPSTLPFGGFLIPVCRPSLAMQAPSPSKDQAETEMNLADTVAMTGEVPILPPF